MPAQKRKAEDVSSKSLPSKRMKLTEDTEVKLSVDPDEPKDKFYTTTVHYASGKEDIVMSETESEEVATMDTSRPRRKCNRKVTAVAPLREMKDGSRVIFDTLHVLQREGDDYTCTCTDFKSKGKLSNVSTCEHLQEYLGEKFENWRCSSTPGVDRNHKKVSVLLAYKFEEDEVNPKGWWLSEKLDGVRAFWDGRCFYSRLGNAFHAPTWFTRDLPRGVTLDGELFGGRGQFQDTVRIVKSGPDADWTKIRFHVFDCPSRASEPFEARMKAIIALFHRTNPENAVFVEQIKCKNLQHLNDKCDKVLSYGGEGIMLRQAGSVYEGVRSRSLLKMKKFYDAEAVVIGHEASKSGSTKYGALRCRMACGKEFSVGSGLSNKDRNNPPKKGSIITYKFQELTNSGVPRFPSYLGIRIDMTSPKDTVLREVIPE